MVSAFKLLLLLLSIFGYSKSRPPTPSDLQDAVNIAQEIEYFDDILPSYYNYNSTKLQGMSYSPQPQPPPRSYSNLAVDCIDGIYRPAPQTSPLTKQVNQLAYEFPKNKYANNPWNYAPEFLKVFGDVRTHVGGKAVFDCVLLGSPRPKVCWLFNEDKMRFTDIIIEDTSDVCRLTIPYVQPYHYGEFTVLCENEVGRAVASAQLLPLYE